MFENRREQERCELILKSITEEKCEQGLYTYLSKCQVLNKPIVKNICLTNKHLDINSDVASCKVKGEITFFYKGKKYNSSFSAEGVSDTIIYPSTISYMIFDGIYIKDTYGKLSLKFDFLGDIVIEPLKIGESITVDGIKCVFERKWESGEWYMNTSKVLMPAQMYKVLKIQNVRILVVFVLAQKKIYCTDMLQMGRYLFQRVMVLFTNIQPKWLIIM